MKSGHCDTGAKTRGLENSVEEGRHLKVRVVPVSNAAVVTWDKSSEVVFGGRSEKLRLRQLRRHAEGSTASRPQSQPACLLALAFPLQGVEAAIAALLLTLSVQEALAFSRH